GIGCPLKVRRHPGHRRSIVFRGRTFGLFPSLKELTVTRLPIVVPAGLLLMLFSLAGTAGAQVPTDAPAPATPPTPAATATEVGPVELKDVKDINAGDTAWMLTSAAFVLMMTGPGLALFYGCL